LAVLLAAIDESVAAAVSSTTTGAVAEVLIVVVVVSGAVLEDRVLLLQALRAKPAKINVNKIEFFIGEMSCLLTDRLISHRFSRQNPRKLHEIVHRPPHWKRTLYSHDGTSGEIALVLLAYNEQAEGGG